ncbi:MAG: MBOAT family protein [Clostridia bacterium]|nr:MBOAT family protein [Clostridia bacterium]
MVFSSIEFLFFFLPVTLILYFAVPKKYLKARNVVLLVFSLIFYGWGEPLYVFLMVFSVLCSYLFGYMVGREKQKGEQKKARAWLIVAVIVNIGLLSFFKYTDLMIGTVNALFGTSLKTLGLALPIGISFYTFQILSYVVDVYRGEATVQKNLPALATYVTLFPQLIAGPIVRYRDVDGQLTARGHSLFLFSSGLRTFICGLSKKVLLANAAAFFFGMLTDVPAEHRTVAGAWLGIILFSFQIYFDFSGYSDMAIGLGKMFGFRFLENFHYPYISRSVTEFWRRWHISLSTWFREYVYIPLGGSRVDKKWKLFRNLLVVWLLTGFWHGASWNFVLWGLLFFVFLVVEKAFLLKWLEKAPRAVGHLYTLLVVLFGWLLFNFTDMAEGLSWLGAMFGFGASGFIDGFTLSVLLRALTLLVFLVIGSTPLPKKTYYKLSERSGALRVVFAVGALALTVLCTANVVSSDFNPFLYWRF